MKTDPGHPDSRPRWPGLPECRDWVGSSAAAARIRGEIATVALTAGPVLIEAEKGSGRRFAAGLIHRRAPAGSGDASRGFVPIEIASVPAGRLAPHLANAIRHDDGGNGATPRTFYLSGIDRAEPADVDSLTEILRTPLRCRVVMSSAPAGKTSGGRGGGCRAPEPPELTTIRIPPLRERKVDISALALQFLTEACGRAGVGPYGISNRMIAAYHDYDWPGNAAELRAVIESAVSTAALARFRGRVLPDSFCAIPFAGDRAGRSLKEIIGDVEKNILENTLHRVGGNQAHAARILRLNTTTLHEKLKRHGMLGAFRQQEAASARH